jgi:hypothetical protein
VPMMATRYGGRGLGMGVFSLLVPDPLLVGLPGAVGSGDGPR